MIRSRLNPYLSLNAIAVLLIVGITFFGRLNTSIASLLTLIWGVFFFPLFYIVGQKKRPLPAADLVTGLRLVIGFLFFVISWRLNLLPALFLILALVLELADGLDGWIARRTGPTDFGGKWDMETDAYIILMLSASAHWNAGLPVWVLIPGVIRYVSFFPFLLLKPGATEFPASLSWFSKTVCVGTVFCLASAWYLPEASVVAIFIASVLIIVSFLWEAFFYIWLRIQTR